MKTVALIIKREYLTRVKKKSFLVMTLLGPLLMAALFIVPVFIAQIEGDIKNIGIVDESGFYYDSFKNTESLHFIYLTENIDEAKSRINKNDLYAILHIPATSLSIPISAELFALGTPSMNITSYLKGVMKTVVQSAKLEASGVAPEVLKSINKTSIKLLTFEIDSSGKEEMVSAELKTAVGFITGLLIYIFIFMYGAQVMRGVIEEKTNRIIEVIISSVKPFQLMMGKIIGVAMVGLTQFILWVVFTLIIVTGFYSFYADDIAKYQQKQLRIESVTTAQDQIQDNLQNTGNEEINQSFIKVYESIQSINFPLIIGSFLFFFITGYLLYAALFAAIGSAVDNETDTQQFMVPVTVPLVLSLVLAQFIIVNPDGPAAVWLSMIPLTAPVTMMIRIPFNAVSGWELALSMSLMIAGFVGATLMAAKIYRTGILMYGKKISYKELWKWLRYKN